jgi:hypothetical protein
MSELCQSSDARSVDTHEDQSGRLFKSTLGLGRQTQMPFVPTTRSFRESRWTRYCHRLEKSGGISEVPRSSMLALIFFVADLQSGQLTASYPAERIDFDAVNIPIPVLSALEEAITCHANGCFVAAAIMVRKALEELCRDRGATGNNLKERIKALGTKVVLPTELLDGLDDLRLLGNDAAHIESREYDKVGQEEVEIGIEFAKEVLKAVYQYSALLGRLRALKKTP